MSTHLDNRIHNTIKLAAEVLLFPGSSLILDGEIKSGLQHAVAGVLARSVFGRVGSALVSANALALSITGRDLYSALFDQNSSVADNLRHEVRRGMEDGKTLEEILESIAEDVEDIYVQWGGEAG